MNMMKMMQHAQNIQKNLQKIRDQLMKDEISGEGAGGAIKVVCDGQGWFKSIKLSKELLNPEAPESVDDDTLETLEDLISTTIIQTTKKATTRMAEKVKEATGGLNLPGMF